MDWAVEYYDILQNTVGGGKPKMKWHFTETMKGQWPVCTKPVEGFGGEVGAPPPGDDAARSALVDALQDKKTDIYKVIVEECATARPGVLGLMDAALSTCLTDTQVVSCNSKQPIWCASATVHRAGSNQ